MVGDQEPVSLWRISEAFHILQCRSLALIRKLVLALEIHRVTDCQDDVLRSSQLTAEQQRDSLSAGCLDEGNLPGTA